MTFWLLGVMENYNLHVQDAQTALFRGGFEANLGHIAAAMVFDPGKKRGVRAQFPPPTLADSPVEKGKHMEALRLLCLALVISPSPNLLLDCVMALHALGLHEEIGSVCEFFPAETVALHDLIAERIVDPDTRISLQCSIYQGASRELIDAKMLARKDYWDNLIAQEPENLKIVSDKAIEFIRYNRFDIALESLLAAAEKMEIIDENSTVTRDIFSNLRFLLRNENTTSVKRLYDAFYAEFIAKNQLSTSIFLSILSEYCVDFSEIYAAAYERVNLSPVPITNLFKMVRACEDEPAATLGKLPTGRRLIYGNLVCWGRKFLDLMNDVCLRSLLSKGNIPTLTETNDLVLEIVTMPQDVENVKNLSSVRKLKKYCCIRIFCLPPEASSVMGTETARIYSYRYLYLNFGFHLTRERARRHGADLLMFFPDVIYSHEVLTHVAAHASDAPRALLMECQNARATPVLREMAGYIDPEDGALSVPPRVLSTLLARHMMPRTKAKIFHSDATAFPAMVMSFIFKEKNGFSTRMLYQGLIYATHAAFAPIPKVNFGFPDSQHTQDVLNRLTDDQIITFSGPDDPFSIEISDEKGNVHTLERRNLLDLIRKNFFEGFYGSAAARLFKRERFFHCDPDDLEGVVDPVAKSKFVAAVTDMIDNDPFFTRFLPMREANWAEMRPDGPGGPRPTLPRTARGKIG